MDFFDERILTTLKDGKPRGFTALLKEAGYLIGWCLRNREIAVVGSINIHKLEFVLTLMRFYS